MGSTCRRQKLRLWYIYELHYPPHPRRERRRPENDQSKRKATLSWWRALWASLGKVLAQCDGSHPVGHRQSHSSRALAPTGLGSNISMEVVDTHADGFPGHVFRLVEKVGGT